MKNKSAIQLIAIVGGSGAGKTWLADRLQQALGPEACRLSLDNFYRDRSHLPPARREQINFDHPRAIDWPCLERVLKDCRAGRATHLPHYNFTSHTRLRTDQSWRPRPLIIVDGLWLLGRPAVRRLFDLRIFLDCPAELRLRRRLARDARERGRSHASVRRQFQATVAPMHGRYVTPQAAWADVVLKQPLQGAEIGQWAERLRKEFLLMRLHDSLQDWRRFSLSHPTRRAGAPSQRVGEGRGEGAFGFCAAYPAAR